MIRLCSGGIGSKSFKHFTNCVDMCSLGERAIKLNLQRPTLSWKLFFGRFINAVMTAHESRITEYERVALGNNFTVGFGITQYVSTNSIWKHSF